MGVPALVDKESVLAKHFLLRHLEPAELRQLASYARLARYPAGKVIFQKGDDGDGMMAVVNGRVKICSHSYDGRELILNIVGPGEVFGEIALLDGEARTADAVALEACDLLVLLRRDFLPFLERHPRVSLRLLTVLCQRLRRTSEQLEDSLFLELRPRLAKCLLRLVHAFGRETPSGTLIDMKLSQQQLGTLVGMTRESINKQLRAWREEGLVTLERGYITVRDREGLELIAEGDGDLQEL
jgi:CRP/FNR family transcriptional regulator, cyclic AMP receptor protein